MKIEDRYLAWFLGPKAENAELFEELLLLVLRDYVHWRRNYFPADPILIGKSYQREWLPEIDALSERLHRLLADLRRNFPFYSPRYIGHQLSDTMVPSMLGYLAGMLFNPNNVTPEAAPVTTHLEVEACDAVLRMLGFVPPPEPPPATTDPEDYYAHRSRSVFGWAHLASGGTTANIEALWVARQTRAFPVAAKAVAKKRKLLLSVQLPDGTHQDIRRVSDYQLLLLKPNEAIYLMPKLVDAVRRQMNLDVRDALKATEATWDALADTGVSSWNGLTAVFGRHSPVLLVAGTAHYSIGKAADVLGIGNRNVIRVGIDQNFRLDLGALDKAISYVLAKKEVPLAVIANVGTTEEGAIDPLHGILDARAQLEKNRRASFWVHADAAWGGFIRTVFAPEEEIRLTILREKLSQSLGLPATVDWASWHSEFAVRIRECAQSSRKGTDPDSLEAVTERALKDLSGHLAANEKTSYADGLKKIPSFFEKRGEKKPYDDNVSVRLGDVLSTVGRFVSAEVELPVRGGAHRNLTIRWPSKEVCAAFLSLPQADSITIDPHKMGYAPYPCGCVAFQNDRVRHFVLQRAPYITASKQAVLIHRPPRHTVDDTDSQGNRKIMIDAFAPFILEGSRPGAAAAGLWLAVKTAPLEQKGHGTIVRASLLAAREVYEWLRRWALAHERAGHGLSFEFVPLTELPPDTNIVTFVVSPKSSNSLRDLNALTKYVYDRFSIQSELGDMQYSYSQAFFLSNTTCTPPNYPEDALESLFKRCDLGLGTQEDYRKEGLTVLRATVMSPYILPLKELRGENLAKAFVAELARVASEYARPPGFRR